MVAKAKTIDVPVESETARMLREADNTPLILHVAGARYRVLREVESDPEARDSRVGSEPDSDQADYDPEQARAILDEVAGTWSNEFADDLIEILYRARIEGSRPIARPEPL